MLHNFNTLFQKSKLQVNEEKRGNKTYLCSFRSNSNSDSFPESALCSALNV